MTFVPAMLQGALVRLEPLSLEHKDGLREAIRDGELWKLSVTLVPHPDEVEAFIEDARNAHDAGDGLAFATIERSTGRVAGSTRFMKAHVAHRRVEIGYTFLGAAWQRTGLNREAKLLMLTHAFETLGMNRVEFLTDVLNEKSRRALAGLGATQEGVLRSHMIMRDGRTRDSVLFSIVRNEWPGVRQQLSSRLAARRAGAHGA